MWLFGLFLLIIIFFLSILQIWYVEVSESRDKESRLYLHHITNEEVRGPIRDAIGFHDDLLTMVKKCHPQMVLSHLTFLWDGKDNSARHSWRDSMKGQAKERRKDYIKFGTGQLREFAKGRRRHLHGTSTTDKVMELAWNERVLIPF